MFKKNILILILFFLFKINTASAVIYQANTQAVDLPLGVSNLSVMDSRGGKIIYGVNNGRLYYSENNGSSEFEIQPAGDIDQNWSTVSVGINGHIVAGVNGGRLYYSDNNGANWSEIQPAGDIDQNWSLSDISDDGSKIIAGVNGGRLYYSSNNGVSWSEIQPAGDIDQNWSAISINSSGNSAIASVNGGRLYYSNNPESFWQEIQPAGDVDKNWSTLNISSNGLNITAGVNGGRLYKTIGGDSQSWQEIQPAGDVDKNWSVSSISDDENNIVVGINNGRLYKTMGGDTTHWEEIQPAGDTNQDWKKLSFKNTNSFFVSNNANLYSGVIVEYTPNNPSNFNLVANITQNEKFNDNAVFSLNTLNTSASNIFSFAHGTLSIGNKIYLGTRTTPAKLVVFNDSNDLSNYDSVSVNGLSSFESMIYDDVHNRIYAAAWLGGSPQNLKIYSINPDNIHDYQLVFDDPSLTDGGSPGMVTDGIYIYGGTYTDSIKIFKIRISDWSLASSKDWIIPGNNFGPTRVHAAAIHKYNNRTEFYLSAALGNSSVAKVNADDLSYEQYNSGVTKTFTDDMAFKYMDENGGIVYTGSEISNEIYAIDTRNMTATIFFGPASYGVFNLNNNLYDMGRNGYIAKYSNFDYSSPSIYKTPGEIPNEFFSLNNNNFFTNWSNPGYLKKYSESTSLILYNSIELNWSSDKTGIFYDAYISTDGINYNVIPEYTLTENRLVIQSGLLPNTHYWIKINAKNGNQSNLGFYDFITASFIPEALSAIPTISSILVTSNSISLNWTGNSNEYYVKSDSGNSGWLVGSNYIFNNLTCKTSYLFSIKGRNLNGIATDYLNQSISTADCPRLSSGGHPNNSYNIVTSGNYKDNSINLARNKKSLNFNINRILKISKFLMKGDDVLALQKYLNKNGFISANDFVFDGVFGNKTKSAVIKFQKKNNLIPDGIVGKETLKILN